MCFALTYRRVSCELGQISKLAGRQLGNTSLRSIVMVYKELHPNVMSTDAPRIEPGVSHVAGLHAATWQARWCPTTPLLTCPTNIIPVNVFRIADQINALRYDHPAVFRYMKGVTLGAFRNGLLCPGVHGAERCGTPEEATRKRQHYLGIIRAAGQTAREWLSHHFRTSRHFFDINHLADTTRRQLFNDVRVNAAIPHEPEAAEVVNPLEHLEFSGRNPANEIAAEHSRFTLMFPIIHRGLVLNEANNNPTAQEGVRTRNGGRGPRHGRGRPRGRGRRRALHRGPAAVGVLVTPAQAQTNDTPPLQQRRNPQNRGRSRGRGRGVPAAIHLVTPANTQTHVPEHIPPVRQFPNPYAPQANLTTTPPRHIHRTQPISSGRLVIEDRNLFASNHIYGTGPHLLWGVHDLIQWPPSNIINTHGQHSGSWLYMALYWPAFAGNIKRVGGYPSNDFASVVAADMQTFWSTYTIDFPNEITSLQNSIIAHVDEVYSFGSCHDYATWMPTEDFGCHFTAEDQDVITRHVLSSSLSHVVDSLSVRYLYEAGQHRVQDTTMPMDVSNMRRYRSIDLHWPTLEPPLNRRRS